MWQYNSELYELLKPLLILAQCLGLMPVHILNFLDRRLQYTKWFISFFMSVLLTINIFFYLYALAFKNFTFNTINEMMNYVFPLIILILFLQTTRRMPKLMHSWRKMEQSMNQFKIITNVPRKTKIIFYSFLLARTALYLHSVALDLFEVYPCIENLTIFKLLKAAQVKRHFNIFSITTWAIWTSILVIIMNIFVIYAPLFMYLYITLITVALSARFQQINHCLESVKHKMMPFSFWKIMREEYNILSCLTKLLDHYLSSVVLLSFSISLYMVCLLLFLNIGPSKSWFHVSYLIFSIIYYIVLTCMMAFSASSIYEESKRPLTVLFSVPSECYCIEVKRFLFQVSCDDLALTGHNFFPVTRTLILTLAGTIVTYEIVLVQFNSGDSDNTTHLNTSDSCEKIFSLLNVI